MDYHPAIDVTDARLKLLCDRVGNLPLSARDMVVRLVGTVVAYLEAGGSGPPDILRASDAKPGDDPYGRSYWPGTAGPPDEAPTPRQDSPDGDMP